MTHFPNIHLRAETLVRESRGRLTLTDAYRELNRRSQAVQTARKNAALPQPKPAWLSRADLA